MTLDLVSAGAAEALAKRMAREGGIEISGTFGAVGAMLEKFLAGEPCDVVILTHEQVARLVSEGRAVPGSSADLGCVATAIAVRAGAPLPSVGDSDGLRAA